jgi:hypothetical protein
MTPGEDSANTTGELHQGWVACILVIAGLMVWIAGWEWVWSPEAPYGDDNSAHMALMMHIAELWRAGEADLWWNQSNLGLPLFLAYQPLAGLASGTGAYMFDLAGADSTAADIIFYKATIVGLWSLAPLAWYAGSRWLGMSRGESLMTALAALVVRDVFDVGFGWTAAVYGGLYTQNWGVVLFPLTVGAFYRWVIRERGSMVLPVAMFVVTSLAHLFVGMYAGIATLLMFFVRPGEWRRTVPRGLAVWLSAIALISWWLVPLLAHNDLAGGLPWKSNYYNGWGPWQMARHITGGQVFDAGRPRIMTVAVAIGGVLVWQHRDNDWARWLMMLVPVTLVLWMGRTTWGAWYGLLPMHEQVNVMRYINGIHACGFWLAGVALASLWRWLHDDVLPRFTSEPVQSWTFIAITLVAISGFVCWRGLSMQSRLKTFDQHQPNVQALVDHLRDDPPAEHEHRFAADAHLNTTPHFYRDLLPALTDRGQLQSYALGYHATLSTYYAEYIEWTDHWFRLFNVSELVARSPVDADRVDGFDKTFDRGPFAVYRVPGADDWGYFDFVRTPMTIEGDYHRIRRAVRPLAPRLFRDGRLARLTGPTASSRAAGGPVVRIEDGPTARFETRSVGDWVDATVDTTASRPTSTVIQESRGLTSYSARVEVQDPRDSLLLKVNVAPYWHATVDGDSVEIDHVTPNFMAIDVPEGSHRVRFEYRNPAYQKVGFIGMLLVLMGWGLLARVRSSQRRGGHRD